MASFHPFTHFLLLFIWLMMIYLLAAFSRSLRVPSRFHFSERLCKSRDPPVAGAWRWMGHLVLCLHHYNIKLLVCLAWNDNQSTEITPMLFVLVKNFCPPVIEVIHDKRVTFYWWSFHSVGYRGFLSSQESLPCGWPRFSFLATLNGNHFF